jgi:16S rRNA (cytidine1402-2'-O)-methyltransferase
MMPKLYLIPSLLDDSHWQNVLPAGVLPIISETRFFIVENIRSARRFIKLINKEINIDTLSFTELNEQTRPEQISSMLDPLKEGNDIALISEAGCPGVADPGQDLVRLAHKKGFQVIPFTGPSSILLSLMASGLNGQNFAFNGYLPVKSHDRIKSIQMLEKKAIIERQTQIFIETPYRNNPLLADILKSCLPSTMLCIAANLTGLKEFIQTKTIQQWRNSIPDLNKQPSIFLLGI